MHLRLPLTPANRLAVSKVDFCFSDFLCQNVGLGREPSSQ